MSLDDFLKLAERLSERGVDRGLVIIISMSVLAYAIHKFPETYQNYLSYRENKIKLTQSLVGEHHADKSETKLCAQSVAETLAFEMLTGIYEESPDIRSALIKLHAELVDRHITWRRIKAAKGHLIYNREERYITVKRQDWRDIIVLAVINAGVVFFFAIFVFFLVIILYFGNYTVTAITGLLQGLSLMLCLAQASSPQVCSSLIHKAQQDLRRERAVNSKE
ncbi:MAG: hypothetical protein AAGE92_10295 [Cyanobacteria bacterium P01_G01_bin.4]